MAKDDNFDNTTDYFVPYIITTGDYYTFGSAMEGRSFVVSGDEYRYGFNGQERDNEIKGKGKILSAQFWQYDVRMGRRWNRDPIVKQHESPDSCYANEIEIQLGAADISRSSFDLVFKMFSRTTQNPLAMVKTGMVCFDYEKQVVKSVPKEFRKTLLI